MIALIESDIHSETQLNISLQRIGGDGGNSSRHNEIPGASHTDISLYCVRIGLAPVNVMVPLWSIELSTKVNPSQALKVFFMS